MGNCKHNRAVTPDIRRRNRESDQSRLWESGGFCEARHGVGSVRDAGWRLIEAGLSEAAVGLALWAEYRGAPGATLIPGGDLTGLVAVGGSDPGCAGARSGVWRPSEVIERAVIGG